MRNSNLLFFKESLDDQLDARQRGIRGAVDAIQKDQFLISTDQQLIEYISAPLVVTPIALCEDQTSMTQAETKTDVSHDPMRTFFHNGGPLLVAATRVDVYIPFTGEAWIFQFRTNPWSSVFPRGEIQQNRLIVSITRPHNSNPNDFKNELESELNYIRDYASRANKQIRNFNASLSNKIKLEIDFRRNRLNHHGNIAALLDIPLVSRPGAPKITPVRIEVRPPPTLPAIPKTGLVPEPGISDETYEQILQFIRHQGRTFERTPGTYAVHGEEELRNIVLGQLNGHFRGDAVAEAFRGKGKTDICIEQDNRAAFVGECKLWTGPEGLKGALEQLLGYLTWRDSKAAIIMFNTRNKEFSRILDAMPSTLRSHPLFLTDMPCSEAGEWRMQMRSAEDEGRKVIVHSYAFNLYQQEGPRIRAV